MKLSATARDLYDRMTDLPVIDAHEHLPPEKVYLEKRYSGLNLFAGYIRHDLESAGLSSDFIATMRDGGYRPVQEWWPRIRDYWQQSKNTSFARALLISANRLYGIDEIDDSTIDKLAECVCADNREGLYTRILQDTCGIVRSITCLDIPNFPDDPGLCGITSLLKIGSLNRGQFEILGERAGLRIRSLDDAAEACRKLLRRDIDRGAVGFKMAVGDYEPAKPAQAEREFREAFYQSTESGSFPALSSHLVDRSLDIAAESQVPVAVHTGYWGDFRKLDPKHMFSFALRRRDVHFDMFHLGMPMLRDAALIGKNLPNVSLNLTWCPIISQVQTRRILSEILDLVPINKIIAFGGDYRVNVQNVFGHLVMAKEAVASALAERIEEQRFDREYALSVAGQWFKDNPERIYGLTP